MRVGFVVLGIQRTGTTLLRRLLDDHPDVRCHGELFRRQSAGVDGMPGFAARRKHMEPYLRLVRSAALVAYLGELERQSPSLPTGFKLMVRQVWYLPEILPILRFRRYRLIALERRDRLAICTSRFHARATGVYSRAEGQVRVGGGIAVDPFSYVKELARIEREYAWMHRWMRLFPTLRINYEDMVADPVGTASRAYRFLGVATEHTPVVRSVKVLPLRPQEVVANWTDVRRVLARTRFARLAEGRP